MTRYAAWSVSAVLDEGRRKGLEGGSTGGPCTYLHVEMTLMMECGTEDMEGSRMGLPDALPGTASEEGQVNRQGLGKSRRIW